MVTAFQKSVEIHAPPLEVWRALVEPALIARWMNRAQVESSWQVGAAMILRVELEGTVYADRGTLEVLEPGRRLAYSHWSAISRLPDTPEARTRIRFELEPTAQGTQLTLIHANLREGTIAKHAGFFWGSALLVLKDVAEGGSGLEPASIERA